MKGKVLTFIIGILVGAIIATSGFLIYGKTVANNAEQPGISEMSGNDQPGGQQGSTETPPEKPDGDNGEEPPEKPEDANGGTNNSANGNANADTADGTNGTASSGTSGEND